jgi:hypothetical protein
MPSLLPRIALAALVLAGGSLHAADDLPKHAPGEVPDNEPKLMLDDLPDLTQNEPAPEMAGILSAVNVEQAKQELDRARTKQQRWQKLAKAGVLSQVEAESTAIQVARAVVKYQSALAAQAAVELTKARGQFAERKISAEMLDAAEATQRTSAALAADAATGLQRQLRLAAEADLDRQRRLYALGATTKTQVKRAEEKLATLPPR